MFKKLIVALLLMILLTKMSIANNDINAGNIASSCYSNNWHEQALLALAQRNFAIESDKERHKLAMQLLHCLAIPDGKIRDGVAFTGLSSWLRANKLSVEVQREMFAHLMKDFGAKTRDDYGVYQPFVALVLAELARVDRKSPYLSDEQRRHLVEKSSDYMTNINDYRGFEDVVGWRHNVAHSADVFLQLVLNQATTKAQLTSMLKAIGQQVLPTNEHFYTYGEPKRLATALLYIFLQNQHNEQDWQNWLQTYITPSPITDWQLTYTSQLGLAKRHNASAFLAAVFVLIADSKNEQLKMLKPALVESLKSLA